MASGRVEDQAFVTLATNDQYCYGALVLGQSLRDNGTTRQLAILVTPSVSQPMRQQLSTVYDVIRQVNPLDSQDAAHLSLLSRPELGITFSKLHCWRLTQFNKCVFLDADTLVLHNVDDLFDREEFSAAPDVGWPDCFNSGVFVFKPSEDTYNSLLQCAASQGSFDGGDQGLLNTFFSGWATQDISKHLPFTYNMTSNISYTYKPALLRFGQDIKIVHFIGNAKPWRYTYNLQSGTVSPPQGMDIGGGHVLSFVQAWWNVFLASIKPRIEEAQAKREFASTFPRSLIQAATTQTAPSYSKPPSSTSFTSPGNKSSKQSQSSFLSNTHSPKLTTEGVEPSPPSTTTTASSSSSNPSITMGIDLASDFGSLTLQYSTPSGPKPPGSPRSRQRAWEQGEVDYLGQDQFDNIQKHIADKINSPPAEEAGEAADKGAAISQQATTK